MAIENGERVWEAEMEPLAKQGIVSITTSLSEESQSILQDSCDRLDFRINGTE
jgi:hypothetical protein